MHSKYRFLYFFCKAGWRGRQKKWIQSSSPALGGAVLGEFDSKVGLQHQAADVFQDSLLHAGVFYLFLS